MSPLEILLRDWVHTPAAAALGWQRVGSWAELQRLFTSAPAMERLP